ncbi:MAG: O-antigen ligase family protein [Myxococcaceae bacterium]
MKPPGGRRWGRTLGLGAFLAAVVGVTVWSLVADGRLFLAKGEGLGALGPLAGFILLWAIWKLPIRVTLLGMTFFTLAVDSPMERPHVGWWTPPWSALADVYYKNLQHTLNLSALRFTGMEFLLLYLVGIVAYRRATRSRIDPPTPPTPRPLARALALGFGALLVLWGYGLLRGGADFTQSVWQVRVLLILPVVAGLFAHALRGPKDQQTLGHILVAAALVKVAVGSYFYFVLCKPWGLLPPYVTTHADSVLFTLAIAACFANVWERPTRKNLVLALAVIPLVGLGLVLNDRRLAWVSLGAMALTLLLVSPWNRAKRALIRAVVVCSPLLIAYVAVGWRSKASVFKPVQVLRSVTASDTGSAEDSSTEFREMENENLVATIRPHPFLGQGFGHEYNEVVYLPDISRFMPFYRYLPHNTVLWLWTLGGWLGFSAMWLYLMEGVFFAARAYHHAVTPLDRASMLVALCAVVGYLNQAFGDMGVQSYATVFTVGPAVALAGTMATRLGAWRRVPRLELEATAR